MYYLMLLSESYILIIAIRYCLSEIQIYEIQQRNTFYLIWNDDPNRKITNKTNEMKLYQTERRERDKEREREREVYYTMMKF